MDSSPPAPSVTITCMRGKRSKLITNFNQSKEKSHRTERFQASLTKPLSRYLLVCAVCYLHDEAVFIAVIFEHIVVHFGPDSVLVGPVDVPDVVIVDFVLALNCADQTDHSWRNL